MDQRVYRKNWYQSLKCKKNRIITTYFCTQTMPGTSACHLSFGYIQFFLILHLFLKQYKFYTFQNYSFHLYSLYFCFFKITMELTWVQILRFNPNLLSSLLGSKNLILSTMLKYKILKNLWSDKERKKERKKEVQKSCC